MELARGGAEVMLVGRDPDRLRAVAGEVRTAAGGAVREHVADLTALSEVRLLAGAIRERYEHVDVLANNAGALFPSRRETADGLERTFALNHLAPFLLTNLLRDRLAGGRVVTTASDAHQAGVLDLEDPQSRRSYRAWRAYGTSKLCNILFTRELARRAPDLQANCYHPGVVRTGFGKNENGVWEDRDDAGRAVPALSEARRCLARVARNLRAGGGPHRGLRPRREGRRAERPGSRRDPRPRPMGAQRDARRARRRQRPGGMTPRPFPALEHPIIQAPMAGGPSTPALAAAVSAAGGLGFIAAGYRSAGDLHADIAAVRSRTPAPIGVNLFLVAPRPVDGDRLESYAAQISADAARHGAALGEPRHDDDGFDAKIEAVLRERPAIVSFTFGCPAPHIVQRLHNREIAVWVTITEVDEARDAGSGGADALVVQGVEAGGHRGSFEDVEGRGDVALLPLLALVTAASDVPLVAAGGIADGAGVAAVLAAGARAAQIGTAFMRTPEAGTNRPHRAALAHAVPTALTRAFTGRTARGIVNAFMRDHDAGAPPAYPHVHHLTAPLRAAARAAGNGEAINLWAGQAYPLAQERPAGELVERWSAQARDALGVAAARLGVDRPAAW